MIGLTKVAEKVVADIFSKIPPKLLAEYIENGRDPILDAIYAYPAEAMQMKQLAKLFSKIIASITAGQVLDYLRKQNPIAAGVIMNHPDGFEWLEKVLGNAKEFIACEDVLCSYCMNPTPLYPPWEKEWKCIFCGATYQRS